MSKPRATRASFGDHLAVCGETYPNVVVLDADLSKSTKSEVFAKKFPQRFFEMGIAEANMIGTGAGLALAGKRPFICSFACFVTGRYDQIRMSISYSGAPVTIVGTHSGVAIGEDGHSQMGLEDIAMMRVLPNMRVLQPCDERDTHQCMDEILKQSEPVYLRLTRQDVPECTPANYKFRFGEPNLVRDGTDMTLFTTGALTSEGVKAVDVLKAKGISVRHVNVTSLKPLRKEAVLDYVRAGQWVVTAEDHYTEGGLGGIMAELLSEHRPTRLHRIGVAGRFGQSGTPEDNYREYGLNHEALALRIQQLAQRI